MNTINLTQEYIIEKYKLDKLEKCLDRIEDDFANKINNGDYKTSDSYFEIVLRSTAKSLLTFRELILLCKNGFPDGALGLSRNIFEQFIILTRFEIENLDTNRNRLVEQFCDDYDIQRCKHLKYMYRYAEKDTTQYDKTLEGYKNKYSISNFSDYWWCGEKSFSKLCRFVIENSTDNMKTMIKNLHISYKRACLDLHACSLGNACRICNTYPALDLSPTDKGQEYALDLSVKSFILIAAIAYRELDLDSSKPLEELNSLAYHYQCIIQNEAD